MEHRNGLLVDFQINQASGTAERDIVPDLSTRRASEAFVRGRWLATRATTRANVWPTSASATSRRMWPRTPKGAAAPSIGAPPVMLVTASAKENASESRRSSAG
jgi:hypothetical protein